MLHVVRFAGDRLGEVCAALNATGYGLTLGLHTRIETTAAEVRRRVRVGNIYVNRNQIGAVVGAQPFGGEGLSGTGPKAGGPHYLHRFATERVVLDRHHGLGRQCGADVDVAAFWLSAARGRCRGSHRCRQSDDRTAAVLTAVAHPGHVVVLDLAMPAVISGRIGVIGDAELVLSLIRHLPV